MYDMVYVQWMDASYLDGPMPAEHVPQHAGVMIHTAGLLVDEDDDFLYIAADYCEMNETVRHINYIPKVLVHACQVISMIPEEEEE